MCTKCTEWIYLPCTLKGANIKKEIVFVFILKRAAYHARLDYFVSYQNHCFALITGSQNSIDLFAYCKHNGFVGNFSDATIALKGKRRGI